MLSGDSLLTAGGLSQPAPRWALPFYIYPTVEQQLEWFGWFFGGVIPTFLLEGAAAAALCSLTLDCHPSLGVEAPEQSS